MNSVSSFVLLVLCSLKQRVVWVFLPNNQEFWRVLKESLQRSSETKLVMREKIILEQRAEMSRLGSSGVSLPCGGIYACLGLSFSG